MSNKHEPLIVEEVRKVFLTGIPYSQICKTLGMSKGQLAGIVDRYGLTRSDTFTVINRAAASQAQVTHKSGKSRSVRLREGAQGIIERQMIDTSRITLIAIPSLGVLEPAAYSYISRDQIVGKKKRGHQSVV